MTIIPSAEANAGTIENYTFACEIEESLDLASLPNEGGNSGGTFSGEGVTDGFFDPSIGPGTYEITYSVDDSADCVIEGTSDFTTFNIIVPGSDELPDEIVMEMCITEVQDLLANLSQAEAFFYNLLDQYGITNLEGDFNEAEALNTGLAIYNYINSSPTDPGNFGPLTYTVTSDCGEESVEVFLTINNAVAPEAGEITPAPVCASETPFDLNSLLGENSNTGGTFTFDGDTIENGVFDVSETGTYEITYTVTESIENCTAGEPDSTEFILIVNEGAVAESPAAAIVCDADVQALFPSVDEIRKYYIGIAQRAGFPTNGTISPNGSQLAQIYQNDEDGFGDFTTTYTFGDGACQTSVDLTVTIVANVDAGENGFVELTTESEEVNLFDYLQGNPMEGGTWSSGNGIFNPNTDEEGIYTYTVTLGSCVDSATVTVTVEDETPTVPTDPTGVVCLADVQAIFPSVDEIRKYYLRLLPTGVATNGSFDPTPSQMADEYQADEDGLGSFTTTYTVNDESYELTVTIVPYADAGEDGVLQVTTEDDTVSLFNALNGTPEENGIWTDEEGNTVSDSFDPATDEEGTFTYTVTIGSCVDSATVTVTLSTNECEGVVDAGTDTSITICETDVDGDTFSAVESLTNYYLGLLDEGVATTGTFDPTPAELLTQYADDEDGLGDFTTTYTLTEGECTASVELTVSIVPVEEANAGTIEDFEVCTSDNALDLYAFLADDSSQGGRFFDAEGNEIADGALDVSAEGDYTLTYTVSEEDAGACVTGSDSTDFTVTVVENTTNAGADNEVTVCNSEIRSLSNTGVRNLYLNLLEEGVDRTGTFEPTIQQLIDQYNFQSNYGDFTTVYTIGTGNCLDSVELTVTVLENLLAGENATVTLTEDDTEIVDLFDELGGTPDEDGTWTDAEGNEVDGLFDPTTDEAGVFTYSVVSENGCEDSATVTVVFEDDQTPCTEFPDAPTVTETFTACAVDGATVADLDITVEEGNTYAVYTDATLETPAANEDVLTSGEYFVTQINAEGCESEDAAVITVTLTDNDAPTISQGGNVFCEFDNATIADLEENVSANGAITWYASATGTDALTAATVLQNNTTYYAASTGADSDCESSERLAVTVTLEVCEIVIPEAFSPNGDQINDYFSITNISSEYPNHRVEIYNRWGDMVYNGRGDSPGWDGIATEGRFGSDVLPVGVYFYILYFNDGQTAPTQGRVCLLYTSPSPRDS